MEPSPPPHSGARYAWLVVFAGLLAWQGWMTLTLFGPDRPWDRLRDDEPIVSGRHPLHLYHGYLGARSFRERGTPSCYDPAFQAGYPKTPVFDSGSRPAELFLTLAGGDYRPDAYKIGLAACCLLVPVLLGAAVRGLGFSGGATCLATALGLVVWWGAPCRRLLDAGELDLLLAGLAALGQVGCLVGFDRTAGPFAWLGLLVFSALGWFTHPLFFAGLLPLVLVYYPSVGSRHCLPWHLALWSALLGGVLANGFWLLDWVDYWWILSPLHAGSPLLVHRTPHTVWAAPLWGDDTDRACLLAVLAGAGIGTWMLNAHRQRAAARLLGLGAGGCLLLALGGLLYEPLGRVGTPNLLVPALWFACPAAGYAALQSVALAYRAAPTPARGRLVVGGLLLTAGVGLHAPLLALARGSAGTTPLAIGLGPEREALVATVMTYTTPEARILWEGCPREDGASRWTALLPVLTGRSYLGGLDSDACIEHGYAGFSDQALAGRPLTDWTDLELEDFCRRYNVGWAVCRSAATADRLRRWRGAEPLTPLPGDGSCWLFRLPGDSFVLKGRARLLAADCERITLADVVPEDGSVVLSLHYLTGLRAFPGRIQIEREPDPHDPIPFIRLRLPGPMARVVLTWPNR